MFNLVLPALALPTAIALFGWFVQFIWLHFFFTGCLERRYLMRSTPDGSKSSWALVTGASDGIGYGFVQELAAHGFNVILHGRNKSKLEGLLAQVRKQHPSQQFKILVADASNRDGWSDAFQTFVTELKHDNVDLRVLVNNVGGTGGSFLAFERMAQRPYESITKTIDVNVTFATTITQALLPYLIHNKPSLIINIGSASAIVPFPYLAMYAASKAFNMYWNDSLNAEMALEGTQVEVLGIVTGKVLNSTSKDTPPSLFVPSSRDFARATLQKVGCGLPNVNAFWAHDLQIAAINVMPTWLQRKILASVSAREMAEELKGR